MNVDDLKQFITTTISLQTSDLGEKIDSVDQKVDPLGKRVDIIDHKIDSLSESVAEAIDNVDEASAVLYKNHERLITKLEHKVA